MSITYVIEFTGGESLELASLNLHYCSCEPITVTDRRGSAKTVWVAGSSLQFSSSGQRWSISVIESEAASTASVALSDFEWPETRYATPEAVAAQTKAPEIPFEVHNPRAVDADRAMAAVRAMCG